MKVLLIAVLGIVLVGAAIFFLPIEGIVQIVNGATAHPVDALGIAVGAVRVALTGLAIWLAIVLSALVGVFLSND